MKTTGNILELTWIEARFLADQIGLARKAHELSREGHLKGVCECDVVWDDRGVTIEFVEECDVPSNELVQAGRRRGKV